MRPGHCKCVGRIISYADKLEILILNETILEMQNVSKTFPGVKALDAIDFNLCAGEVHALLGENGAGKSTLIKVLGGIYAADEGRILIDGKPVCIDSVQSARNQGISIIHQELMIVPEMSISDNLYMGREIVKDGFIDKKTMNFRASKFLESFGLELNPSLKVRQLSIANQQMVEIIRAVSFGARIIVMDEPTSSLTDKEVNVLFAVINQLRKQGIGIIYISHRLNELDEISDRITVMRDGKKIGTLNTSETNHKVLISLMVGRELKNFYIKDSIPAHANILEVDHLSDGNIVKDVSFCLHKGEILGFAGLVGAGRSETMKCLFGLTPKTKGTVRLEGRKIEIRNPKTAIKLGFGLVPENRKEEGLFPDKDIKFNVSLEVLDQFMHGIVVDKKREQEIVENYCSRMKVKAPAITQLISKLSGGNQQKVIIGRWLASNPRILILDEPTRGIDVGAKAEIYGIMNDLAKEGIGIIFISSELPELLNMSDRIAVMSHGEIAGVLDAGCSQQEIMHLATMGIA